MRKEWKLVEKSAIFFAFSLCSIPVFHTFECTGTYRVYRYALLHVNTDEMSSSSQNECSFLSAPKPWTAELCACEKCRGKIYLNLMDVYFSRSPNIVLSVDVFQLCARLVCALSYVHVFIRIQISLRTHSPKNEIFAHLSQHALPRSSSVFSLSRRVAAFGPEYIFHFKKLALG